MNKKINESLNFLFLQFRRLKIKDEKKLLNKEEKETLKKLSSFLGKKVD